MNNILDENQMNQPVIQQPLFNRTLLVVSSVLVIIGFAFRIMHWPLSGVLITINIAVISGHLLSRVVWRKASPGIIVLIVLLCGLFSYYILFWRSNATYIYLGIVFIFIVVEGIIRYRKSQSH